MFESPASRVNGSGTFLESSTGKRALRVGEAYKSERRVGARLSRTAFDDDAATHTAQVSARGTPETDHDRDLLIGGVPAALPPATPRTAAARAARAACRPLRLAHTSRHYPGFNEVSTNTFLIFFRMLRLHIAS